MTLWDVVPEWEGKPDEESGMVVDMADREPASSAIIVAKREGWENSDPNADGSVAKCGGPGLCSLCQREQEQQVGDAFMDGCNQGFRGALSERAEEEREADWFEFCVKQANKHPSKSLLHVIWWSLRSEDVRKWDMTPEGAMGEWVKYLEYKIEDQVKL